MAARTTRAVGYIRTATTAADKEHWTGGQALRISRYCSERGMTLVGAFADYGVAADGMERTGLRDAMSLLREGQADVLVVLNVSRLARSVVELARLVTTNFGDGSRALVAIDEAIDTRTANGKFVLSLLSVIGRWDAEAIGHG